MQTYQPTGKEVPFGGGRFLLSHRLGNGSFGDIFEGYDKQSKRVVAVKLERKKARYPQLSYESKVYRVLHQPPIGQNEIMARQLALDTYSSTGDSAQNQQIVKTEPYIVVGIPQIFYFDSEGDYNIMVMELCGPSLEDVFNYCHRRFSLKTVLMLAEQLLNRIQYFHEKGFVHRDIKPENFVLGNGIKGHIIYIIDYGLSKLYWEVKKNSHIPFAEGRPLTGTARYCSANVHRGYEQSRRDDLESIGFLFIYFLQGSLPWQGIQAKDQQLKTIKIGEKKISVPLDELCAGLPREFMKYCQYCRALSFTSQPDYDYLRGLFRGLAKRLGYALASAEPPLTAAATANGTTAAGRPDGQTFSLTPATSPRPLKAGTMGESQASINSSRMRNADHTPSNTSKRSQQVLKSPSTVAAQVIPYDDNCSSRGFYDWQFDWFCKRQEEVANGERYNQRRQDVSASPPKRNSGTDIRMESVSVDHDSNKLKQGSEIGSKQPLATTRTTETDL